ncbi:hypothetical protein KPL71_001080 [Citrus sinensis]|uniref:Uncharacterized protein n=1 Tax=Citrus sinensis TaxID=2711 RepID=A0ACB8NTL0_CITSI|nr:hypothetical protein KPL71_001080 [Citrus sinensis]
MTDEPQTTDHRHHAIKVSIAITDSHTTILIHSQSAKPRLPLARSPLPSLIVLHLRALVVYSDVSSKHEIEKFTIGGDLSLWKLKMRALLVHRGLEYALEEDDPEAPSTSMSDEKRKQIQNRTHSTLILSLSDSILREISEEKTTLGIWNKVEALCMKKSLAHRLFLKKRLYTFSMREGVSIQDHIDTFNKIIIDLEGVENVKISDEDKAFFLLSSLPKPYEDFIDTVLYGRISLTLEDVKASLCSKEIQRNENDENSGEGLVARNEKKKDQKDNGGIRVTKGGTIVMRGEKKNGLYVSIGSSIPVNVVMTVESDVDKTKVVKKFKVWKALVENQRGRKLKALRTYNGLEFCNRKFETFCQKHDILRHKTVRFTPQQNGLAKRMNRTIVDKTRCMLINSKLSRCFWVEAVSTTCYLVNRSPSAAIDFKTLEEIWFGRPPKFENLRIFGCPAYVHINQGKLNARALKGFFIGYPDGIKGYRVWCGEQRKCIISRDVVFHEATLLKDNTASNVDILTNNDSEQSAESPKLKVEFSGHERVAFDSEDMVYTEDQDIESPTLQQTDLQDYQLARDRERRQIRAPDRLGYADLIAFVLVSADEIAIEELGSYSEAISGKDCDKWLAAMQEEMDSLQRNKTWTVVPNLRNRKLISSLLDMELEQMNVKTAFLHGNLEEQLLIKQPEDQGGAIYLLLYVDDMLIASKHKSEVEKLKNLLKSEFEMKDLGSAKRILGMEIFINRAAGTLFLSQEKYIKKVLERFDMHNSKPVLTPLGSQFKLSAAQLTEAEKAQMDGIPYAQAVGSLMYAMVCTRPDIAFAVSVISRFLSYYNKTHWGVVKWIMRYHRGSSTYGLLYGKSRNGVSEIVGYVDSDFAGDLDKRKSISGYMFMLNMCIKTVQVFCDNQSALQLIKNPVFHERTKHIDVKLQFIREEAAKGTVSMSKIHTDMNPADALTKVLPTVKFEFCVNLMGVLPNSN